MKTLKEIVAEKQPNLLSKYQHELGKDILDAFTKFGHKLIDIDVLISIKDIDIKYIVYDGASDEFIDAFNIRFYPTGRFKKD